MTWFLDLMLALPLIALLWGFWHVLGLLAQRMGMGRLQLLGGAALIGWLIDR